MPTRRQLELRVEQAHSRRERAREALREAEKAYLAAKIALTRHEVAEDEQRVMLLRGGVPIVDKQYHAPVTPSSPADSGGDDHPRAVAPLSPGLPRPLPQGGCKEGSASSGHPTARGNRVGTKRSLDYDID